MTSKLATHMNEINTAVQVVLSQLSTCFFVECVTNVKGPFFFYQSASYYEQWGPTRTQHFFYIWTIFVISHKRFLVCLAAFESNCDESFVVVYLATSVSQIWSNQNPHSLIITLIATQFHGEKIKMSIETNLFCSIIHFFSVIQRYFHQNMDEHNIRLLLTWLAVYICRVQLRLLTDCCFGICCESKLTTAAAPCKRASYKLSREL